MPSWNQLLEEIKAAGDQAGTRMEELAVDQMTEISHLRGGRNVMLYASSFLQKPGVPPLWQTISKEDLNGFMTTIYGLDCSKGLSLILHTPGGDLNAIETIVAYLWSKFEEIEVIVPTYAMSAGTMLALASNRVVMGRQSQLGPTDPQLSGLSAGAIVEQFDMARSEIIADQNAAHAWAPVLQVYGPSLYQEARNALEYAQRMVGRWLACRMFAGHDDPEADAEATAKHFGDTGQHLSHGRRIDRDEARGHGVVVEDLEDDQDLQEAVLTLYHLTTIIFEKSPATKLLRSSSGLWVKNYTPPASQP